MDREALGWALVFSIPPGVGITGFATYLVGGGAIEPVAVAAGAGAAAVIFVVVAAAFAGGSVDPDREDEPSG